MAAKAQPARGKPRSAALMAAARAYAAGGVVLPEDRDWQNGPYKSAEDQAMAQTQRDLDSFARDADRKVTRTFSQQQDFNQQRAGLAGRLGGLQDLAKQDANQQFKDASGNPVTREQAGVAPKFSAEQRSLLGVTAPTPGPVAQRFAPVQQAADVAAQQAAQDAARPATAPAAPNMMQGWNPMAAPTFSGSAMDFDLTPRLPGYGRGGSVSGGTKGVDSVQILAQADEYVLPVKTTAAVGVPQLDALVKATNGKAPGPGPVPATRGKRKQRHQGYARGGAVEVTPWRPLAGSVDDYVQAGRQRAVYGRAGADVPVVSNDEMAARTAPDTRFDGDQGPQGGQQNLPRAVPTSNAPQMEFPPMVGARMAANAPGGAAVEQVGPALRAREVVTDQLPGGGPATAEGKDLLLKQVNPVPGGQSVYQGRPGGDTYPSARPRPTRGTDYVPRALAAVAGGRDTGYGVPADPTARALPAAAPAPAATAAAPVDQPAARPPGWWSAQQGRNYAALQEAGLASPVPDNAALSRTDSDTVQPPGSSPVMARPTRVAERVTRRPPAAAAVAMADPVAATDVIEPVPAARTAPRPVAGPGTATATPATTKDAALQYLRQVEAAGGAVTPMADGRSRVEVTSEPLSAAGMARQVAAAGGPARPVEQVFSPANVARVRADTPPPSAADYFNGVDVSGLGANEYMALKAQSGRDDSDLAAAKAYFATPQAERPAAPVSVQRAMAPGPQGATRIGMMAEERQRGQRAVAATHEAALEKERIKAAGKVDTEAQKTEGLWSKQFGAHLLAATKGGEGIDSAGAVDPDSRDWAGVQAERLRQRLQRPGDPPLDPVAVAAMAARAARVRAAKLKAAQADPALLKVPEADRPRALALLMADAEREARQEFAGLLVGQGG
jgi:hypothetical protein